MKTAFISRFEAKRLAKELAGVEQTYALISVNDTEREVLEMTEAYSDLKMPKLFISFLDDESNFNEDHAKVIVDFIYKNQHRAFLVHCFAGVSRSAAISRFIEIALLGKLSAQQQSYRLYNRHVLKVLEDYNASVAQ